VLVISGLHLVCVARLSSFASLSYSYVLLVCPHSLRWRTAPTHFSFDLIFADLHSDVWQKRRVRYRWPTSRLCCSFVLIRRTGLFVRIARLPSFSLLANILYWLLVGPYSPCWPTVPTRRSSALILHAGLLLLRVTRLTSFFMTYIGTFGRNTVLGIGGLHLVLVARLSSFTALAHSYALLIFPHSPCWPTSPTHSASTLILPYLLFIRVARLPLFSLLAYTLYALLV